MEQLNILDDSQNGFRKNRSCSQHIFVLQSIIRHTLGTNDSLFLAYIDFRKAFDVVDRELLYHRLELYGIDGAFLDVIKQVYTETENLISVEYWMGFE